MDSLNSIVDRYKLHLLAILLFALPYQRIWSAEFLYGLQPFDLLVLLVLVLWAIVRAQKSIDLWDHSYIRVGTLFLVVCGSSALYSGSFLTKEMLSLLYLGAVFLCGNDIGRTCSVRQRQGAYQVLVISAVLPAVLCLALYLANYFGLEHPWIRSKDVGYFIIGHHPRIVGPMLSSSMFAAYLATILIVMWQMKVPEELWSRISFFTILLALFLCFSKLMIPLAIIGCFIFLRGYDLIKWLVIGILIAIYFLLMTFFPRASVGSIDHQYFYQEATVLTDNVSLYETNYHRLKLIAAKAVTESRGLGIGAGRFPEYIQKLKSKAILLDEFPDYDPHSSLLGLAAEYGLLATVCFLFFLYTGWTSLGRFRWLVLFYALVAIHTDIHYMRHFWFLLGLLMGGLSSKCQSTSSIH